MHPGPRRSAPLMSGSSPVVVRRPHGRPRGQEGDWQDGDEKTVTSAGLGPTNFGIATGSSPVSGDSTMTSRRRSTLVSSLVLTLALAAGGRARAQIDLDDIPCIPYPTFGGFDLGYVAGTAAGILPFDSGYGSFGVAGYGGFGEIGAFPLNGYGWGINNQSPQTTSSFQPRSDVMTGAPGRSVRARRIPRKPRRAQVAPRTIGHVTVPKSVRQPGESSSASTFKYDSLLNSRNP